jgi:parvulin-like peptidyl-prolyl isomerase
MSFSRSALLALCLGAIGASVAVSQTGPPPASKAAAASSRSPGRALVVVNGRNITDRELEQLLAARQAGDAVAAEVRKIGEFLASRKTTATRQEIDAELDALRTAAKRQGNDPDRTLAAVGYPLEFLREEIGRRLAWRKHVDRTISPERLKAYFSERRAEFDGTQVRAGQIFRKVEAAAPETEWQQAEDLLAQLRERIDSRRIGFAEAAQEYSQAPTKDKGGDVGYFPYAGRMPEEFSRAAFGLKVGEISRPFRTPFGVHLCLVTERRPGDLSLEDVREEVLKRLSQELWDQTVVELRKAAKIEWKVEEP